MPHFHFDIIDTGHLQQDDDGLEFPDVEAARKEALRTLGEIARDEMGSVRVRGGKSERAKV